MSIRTWTIAPLLLLLSPYVATGQTRDSAGAGFDRFSLQVGAGPLLNTGGGHTMSAAFGFSPFSRIDFLVNVERNHLPFQRDTFSDGFTITRAGTLHALKREEREFEHSPRPWDDPDWEGWGDKQP